VAANIMEAITPLISQLLPIVALLLLFKLLPGLLR